MSTASVRTRAPDSQVMAILARAASPAERLAGGWLRPTGDNTIADERLARWMERIAGGRPERVAQLLAERGWTIDDLRASLGDVEAVPGQPVPQWASDAVRLLDLVGSTPDEGPVPTLGEVAGAGLPDWVDAEQPWRFHPGFRDWLAEASATVDGWATGAPVSARARRDLVLDLARRQLVVCGPLLMERSSTGPLFVRDPADEWIDVWTSHPVVARLLAVTWRQWRTTTAELLERITRDLPEAYPGVGIDRIELSAGDQHGGGRGVVRLRLSDGRSLFGKPRSDGLHRVLGEVISRVDGQGEALGLRLPEVLDRGDYVWVREVPSESSDGDLDGYFRRAGALLRVLQAMGATDLHHENFVATADQPVLVDLETVVAPGPLRTAVMTDDAVARRLADTPGPTSMVTSAVDGPPGRASADLGALAGPDEMLTPYAVRTLVSGASGPELQGGRVLMANGTALPLVDGRRVRLRGHEGALIDGYTDVQQRLERLAVGEQWAEGWASGEGREPEVRVVVRPTRVYARLLAQSTTPAALVDGIERELVLDRLRLATGTAPVGLIDSEVDAMRDLDIPLFTSPFASTDLLSDRGDVMPDALQESSADRMGRRLAAVAERDDQLDDLRATVFAMDPCEPPPTPPLPASAASDAIDVLREPVDVLLRGVIREESGSVAWIGLEHDPTRYRWAVGRLGPGLTGQAGVGLALAAVVALRSDADPTCREVARAALLGSAARIANLKHGPTDAFTGPSGVAYAAARAGVLLDDEELIDAARSLIDSCLAAARTDQPCSVIDGPSGGILALLHLPRDGRVDAAIDELVALLDAVPAEEQDVDAPDVWTMSLPSRAAGRALARHRLGLPQAEGPELDGVRIGDAIVPGLLDSRATWLAPSPTGTLRELLDRAVVAQVADGVHGEARDDAVAALVEHRQRYGRWAAPLLAPDSMWPSGVHGMAALAMLSPDLGTEVPKVRALA